MENLSETLEDLDRLTVDLEDPASRDGAVRPFAQAFYDLYVIRRDEPQSEELERIEAFLAASAPRLRGAMGDIDYALSNRLETALGASWEDQEWLGVCRLRSTMEALRELYGPHLPMDELMPQDDELDALLREKGEDEAFQDPYETPITFPATHWWWGMT